MPSKHYPVQRLMSVSQPQPAANIMRIDTPKFLSQVNHRLYRQSRTYDVSVKIDANVADGTTVDVYALADTWYLKGALKLAKTAWDTANAEEIAMNGGKTARWNDFRIIADVTGSSSAQVSQFDWQTLNQRQFTAGEFVDSIVVDQAGVSRTFCIDAPSPAQYNIFEEYDEQSGTNTDPTVPSTGPYTGLLPNLETAAAAAISDSGNNPPYSATGYGNGVWVKVGTLHLAAGRHRLSTGFFRAPLGAVVLTGVGPLGDVADIQIEVKGGDYKGVMSHSMLE